MGAKPIDPSFEIRKSAEMRDDMVFVGVLHLEQLGLPPAELLFHPARLQFVLRAGCGCAAGMPVTELVLAFVKVLFEGHGGPTDASTEGGTAQAVH